MCTFDPKFPNYPFPEFFLSACITNSQFTYNNNYHYTVAIVKQTRKNEQTGLNMDLLYWRNIRVKWVLLHG